jgi:hypothetical protein
VQRSLLYLAVAALSFAIVGAVALHRLAHTAAEWHFALILFIVFQIGVAMTCSEVVKWWRARMAQFRPPPLSRLVTYILDPDKRWRATHVLGFPLSHDSGIPKPVQHLVQIVEEDPPKKAA